MRVNTETKGKGSIPVLHLQGLPKPQSGHGVLLRRITTENRPAPSDVLVL